MKKRDIRRMRKNFTAACKTGLFLCIGVIIFFRIQSILTPRYHNNAYAVSAVNVADQLAIKDADVLFLGTSHVLLGVSPMELYEDYGILSYSVASSGQPIECSYFLLKELYKTHCAKTVVLDVSAMFLNEDTYRTTGLNEFWRYVLENLKGLDLKYELAKNYSRYEWSDGFLSAIFPIIKYHSKWTDITKQSFYSAQLDHYYSFGQYMISASNPIMIQREDIDYATTVLSDYRGKKTESVSGVITSEEIDTSLYEASISAENLEYFLKIVEICRNHGSQLLLIKIPSMQLPQRHLSAWTLAKSIQIKELAKSNDLNFIDLLYDVDSLISLETDSSDAGNHLNSLGAEKVSDYLGNYLIEHGLTSSKSHPAYDNALKKYRKIYSVIKLQSTVDFKEYIRCLTAQKERLVIIVAASDEYVLGMTEEDYRLLSDLGLKLISEGEFRDSYIGILSKGENIYEAISDYEIKYTADIDGAEVKTESRNGWILIPGASIRINGEEYARSDVGLNIAIYDLETGCVVDAVTFNTNNAAQYCVRDTGYSQRLLEDYESVLCFDGWRW